MLIHDLYDRVDLSLRGASYFQIWFFFIKLLSEWIIYLYLSIGVLAT